MIFIFKNTIYQKYNMSICKNIDKIKMFSRWINITSHWKDSNQIKSSQGLVFYDNFIMAPLQSMVKQSQDSQEITLCDKIMISYQDNPQQQISLLIKNKNDVFKMRFNSKHVLKIKIQQGMSQSDTMQCLIDFVELQNKQVELDDKAPYQIKKIYSQKQSSQVSQAKIQKTSSSLSTHTQKKNVEYQIPKDNTVNQSTLLSGLSTQELLNQIEKQKQLSKPTQRLKNLIYQLSLHRYHSGDYDECLKIGKELLPLCLRLYGKNSKEYSEGLEMLGLSNHKLFKYDISLQNFQKALKIAQEIKNNEDSVSRILSNMAILYQDKKGKDNFKKAEDLYNEVLTLTIKKYGVNHLSLASIYNNMGIMLRQKKLYQDACKKFKRALEVYQLNQGRCCYQCAVILDNLTVCQFLQDKYDAFVDNYRQVFTIMKVLGLWSHPQNTKGFLTSFVYYTNQLMKKVSIKKEFYVKIMTMMNNIFVNEYQNQETIYAKYYLNQRIRNM